MKNLFKTTIGLFAFCAALAFAACSNSSDSTVAAASSGESISAVETKGAVSAATNGVATLVASNGSYVFTQSGASANAAISASATVDTTKSGTWIFKDTSGNTKYSGTYKGDISQFGSSEVKLALTVEKAAGENGALAPVEGTAPSFDFDAGTSAFAATIPSVTVEAVAAVTELTYSSDDVNNKFFRYENDDDDKSDSEYIYVLFTNGHVYIDYSEDSVLSDLTGDYSLDKDGLNFIESDGKIYIAQKTERSSGTGICSTYTGKLGDGDVTIEIASASSGTYNCIGKDGTIYMDFNYTNNKGFVVITGDYEGEVVTKKGLYDGDAIYMLYKELTYYKVYTPSNND